MGPPLAIKVQQSHVNAYPGVYRGEQIGGRTMGTTPGAPSIGERVRQLRNGLMTQTDLAAAADVPPDVIRKLEQGQRNTPSIASLHRIVRALDVDLGDLLGRRAMPESASHASCTRG